MERYDDDKKDEFEIEDAEFGFGTVPHQGQQASIEPHEESGFHLPDFLKNLKNHDFSGEDKASNTIDDLFRFNKIMDRHSMLSVSDHSGRIVHISDAFCEASKYERTEILGKVHNIFKSGKHEAKFYKKLWDTVKSGAIWEGQICNKAKDGSFFWLQTTILPFKGKKGRVSHYISICNDITSQKKQEVKIKAAQHQAEKENSSKTAFLGKVSHELRTPLNAVLGFTELLESGVAGELANDSQREYLGQIRRGGEQLLQLVSDLVDMSRIESGNITLYQDDMDLRSLLEDEATRIKAYADEHEISLKLELPDEAVMVKTDSLRLRQVLMNITSNAIKFSHSEDNVTIKLTEMPNKNVEISIEDKGIGMTETEIKNVFKPFQQSENKLIRYQDGLGLGLTIAKYFTELMGGTLKIESKIDKGTKVTIRL